MAGGLRTLGLSKSLFDNLLTPKYFETNKFYILSLGFIVILFTQCKKDKSGKLENPLGLMLLGSDTTLPDGRGRYVIRTKDGCSGWANTLRIEDNFDEYWI